MGSLISNVDSDCAECDGGVDMDKAAAGIPILAQTLRAYCSLTGRMVWNVTGESPGRGSSYEDLWRLTLANYAGGAGCLSLALKAADQHGLPKTWEAVSAEIPEACSGARKYVEDVSGR